MERLYTLPQYSTVSIPSTVPCLLNAAQRERVRNFHEITQCSEKVAIHCLQTNNWKMEQAVDYFYRQNQVNSGVSVNEARIEQLFQRYRGKRVGK
ncbi:hypothetical protein X801_07758 [Opisthorchis viverrini]|uniref:Uncharacterized protein n=1 Tax=Opisthorchis viverrini TaxID=6198 RepID=A0A1S8WPI2_OPIVI|nr:hypothetical protein X801_07758 [Opisthorchis viverrini]